VGAQANCEQYVYEALQPAIRYAKADCLDLPEVVYQTREVPLTNQVLRYYKERKNENVDYQGGRGGDQRRQCGGDALEVVADFRWGDVHRHPRGGGVRCVATAQRADGSAG